MTWPPDLRRITGRSDNPPVRCDCGRRVSLDMLFDVRAIPPTVRGNQELACDACREKWIRKGLIRRAELQRALGAPDHVIEKAKKLDSLADQRRSQP